MVRACALGIREPTLSKETAAALREIAPWGLILFREACVDVAQARALCADLREAVGRDAMIWIDQEGGRVARMRPPAWPKFPPPAAYGAVEAGAEAAWLGYRLIAHELRAIGVNGDFAPVLDLPQPDADPVVVGDRAFAKTADQIAALGRAALEGLHAGGVAGSIKHMPGHGRARVDSHYALPVVDVDLAALEDDIAPFRALKDAEAAVTAHIVFTALDRDRPATQSPEAVAFMREKIGFAGLLFSDDLDMKALTGSLRTRAEHAIAAGCDIVLQCSGLVSDMRDLAEGCPELVGAAHERAKRVEAIGAADPAPLDPEAGWVQFRALLGEALA